MLNAVIFFSAGFTFLKLADDVWFREGFSWDAPIMLAIHQYSQPWLDTLFIGITNSAGKYIPLFLLGALVLLWIKHKKIEIVSLIVSLVGAIIINGALKILFARPRPAIFPPITVEYSYSFPSGHTMTAMAFYGFVAILLWQWHRRIWALAFGGWVLLVALSRVYLGVHYPSDVLGALAVGALWLIIVEIFYFQTQQKQNNL